MAFENLFEVLAELPVAVIADDVTLSVLSGVVTILSSDTGSSREWASQFSLDAVRPTSTADEEVDTPWSNGSRRVRPYSLRLHNGAPISSTFMPAPHLTPLPLP